jgi:hypothetical protein
MRDLLGRGCLVTLSLVCTLFCCVQGIAARLAGGDAAVFDDLPALAQQAASGCSCTSTDGRSRPVVQLAVVAPAAVQLGAEEALQQLQESMQGAAAGLALHASPAGGHDAVHDAMLVYLCICSGWYLVG